jgi:hypothetical protein
VIFVSCSFVDAGEGADSAETWLPATAAFFFFEFVKYIFQTERWKMEKCAGVSVIGLPSDGPESVRGEQLFVKAQPNPAAALFTEQDPMWFNS